MKRLFPVLSAVILSGCVLSSCQHQPGGKDWEPLTSNAVQDNIWASVKKQLLKDRRFTAEERRAISSRRPDANLTRSNTEDVSAYELRWNMPHSLLVVKGHAKTLKELSKAEIERAPAKR